MSYAEAMGRLIVSEEYLRQSEKSANIHHDERKNLRKRASWHFSKTRA